MREIATAWAAGLFEGEGCIEISRPPRSRTAVRLYLVTTDLDVLEKFKAVAGCGSIVYLMAPSLLKPGWKQSYRWSIGRSVDCERLLNDWLPHLGQRRSQRAREALELLAEKEEARRQRRPATLFA